MSAALALVIRENTGEYGSDEGGTGVNVPTTAAITPVPAAQSQNLALSALVQAVIATLPSKHSQRAYKRHLREFLEWSEGTFSRLVVTRYIAERRAAGTSPASLNQALAAIKRLASEALHNGVLSEPGAAAITQIKGTHAERVRCGQWLTADQARTLVDAPLAGQNPAPRLRDTAVLALLIGCGLRRSELCGLVIEQVQPRAGRIVLVDVLRKREKLMTVPVPTFAVARLDNWLAYHAQRTGPLFPQLANTASPLSTNAVWSIVRLWARKALGIQLGAHDCRRTFASLCLDAGAELRAIQGALGHASILTTERYLGTIQSLKDPACDKITL